MEIIGFAILWIFIVVSAVKGIITGIKALLGKILQKEKKICRVAFGILLIAGGIYFTWVFTDYFIQECKKYLF